MVLCVYVSTEITRCCLTPYTSDTPTKPESPFTNIASTSSSTDILYTCIMCKLTSQIVVSLVQSWHGDAQVIIQTQVLQK